MAQRLAALTPDTTRRNTAYPQRSQAQQHTLNLPAYPTTTIGSFPQTLEVREARAQFKSGKLSESDYEAFLKAETERCVRTQEEIGLDVLVHGEFERNDMVEYFGEQLDGFIFTQARLGTELRITLCQTTHHLWRCSTSSTDDRHLVGLRTITHRQTNERDAHRSGDNAAMVVCTR